MTLATLLTAFVPELRGNPAGRLVDGSLPGVSGAVELSRGPGEGPTYGDLTGDGVGAGAAVIGATSGAGGGDSYVGVYTNGSDLLATFDPAHASSGVHAFVRSGHQRRTDLSCWYQTTTRRPDAARPRRDQDRDLSAPPRRGPDRQRDPDARAGPRLKTTAMS